MKNVFIAILLTLYLGLVTAKDTMTFVHPGGMVGQADQDVIVKLSTEDFLKNSFLNIIL